MHLFFSFCVWESFLSIIISKNLTLQQNSIRRNWMSEQLSGVLIHVTGTPPWLLRLVKVSTSSELYPDCFRLPTVFDCSGIQFLIHLSFPNLVSYGTFGYLPLTAQYLCHLREAMPHHWSPATSHPTLLPRVLRIWGSVFYLTLIPAVFKAFLGAGSSISRLAGLHADLGNIALARQFAWITEIHKRFIL